MATKGEVWQEKDKRMKGRRVRLLKLENGKWLVEGVTSGRKTRIAPKTLESRFVRVED